MGVNIADLSASNFDFGGIPPEGEFTESEDIFAGEFVDVFDMDALI